MDKNELMNKIEAFVGAYYMLLNDVEEVSSDDSVRIISLPIDELYELKWERVDTIQTAIVSIFDREIGEPVFWYTLDEDFTIGDIIGGYLDVTFKG